MIKCYSDKKGEVSFLPFNYPAGEVAYKIEAVPDKIICWFESSDDILLAGMLSEQFPDAKLFFPYLPFGREDRRVSDNSSFGLNFFNRLFLDRNPITFDVHNPSVAACQNIKPDVVIDKAIKDCQPDHIIYPDAGALGRYMISEEEYCGVKKRDLQTGEIISYELTSVPQGQKLLVVDDICDGGRTFIELAKLLPGKELYLYVSHGIFSKGFNELKEYYRHIYTTNSYKGERDNEFVTEYRCI